MEESGIRRGRRREKVIFEIMGVCKEKLLILNLGGRCMRNCEPLPAFFSKMTKMPLPSLFAFFFFLQLRQPKSSTGASPNPPRPRALTPAECSNMVLEAEIRMLFSIAGFAPSSFFTNTWWLSKTVMVITVRGSWTSQGYCSFHCDGCVSSTVPVQTHFDPYLAT